MEIENGKLKMENDKLMFIGVFAGTFKASLREGGGTRSVTEGACAMSG